MTRIPIKAYTIRISCTHKIIILDLPFGSCNKSIKQELNNYALDTKNGNFTKEDKKKVVANRNKIKQKRPVMECIGTTKW